MNNMNVALVGSNFALRGYLPAIKNIKNLKLKILCSRNIFKSHKIYNNHKKIKLEYNWKKVFRSDIDLIILAVPPKVQIEILNYNLKFKKKIIFEKPISNNINLSKNIIRIIKRKKIKSDINLTFLNHQLFVKTRNIIKKQKLGKILNFKILWSFRSFDLDKKIKSWKTIENQGGGIKNIFLTHVFSYCEFFFGNYKITNYEYKISNFKGIDYKRKISCSIKNQDGSTGMIRLFAKKKGVQEHKITIKFEKGQIQLFTKSKDWTKNFVLKIHNEISKKRKTIKSKNLSKFKDGRSYQIFIMLKNFLKKKHHSNIDYCLNAEYLNSTIR